MYLYSNIIGTFVFNQNFQIREKILFSEKDTEKIFLLLADGKMLESEKLFIRKFKNIVNLRINPDIKIM